MSRDKKFRLWHGQDRLTGKTWEEASEEPGYLYQMELRLLDDAGRRVRWQEKLLTGRLLAFVRRIGEGEITVKIFMEGEAASDCVFVEKLQKSD